MLWATRAPSKAPEDAATCRTSARRTLERPVPTKRGAAPMEVAITPSRLTPTASGSGRCTTRVRSGTITRPPPKPVSAPMTPASTPPAKTTMTIRRGVIKYSLVDLKASRAKAGRGAQGEQEGLHSPVHDRLRDRALAAPAHPCAPRHVRILLQTKSCRAQQL